MVRIRRAVASDAPFLREMLAEAVGWRAEGVRARVEALSDPAVTRFISGWQRPSDDGVVALDDAAEPIGACWFRILPERDGAPGFVATGVPELTLGVRPVHRARGVGRALLRAACALAAERGHLRVGLAVERDNFAHRLAVEEGFVVGAAGATADTMVRTLR